MFDAEFLQQRIDATKASITAYEDAETALAGGVQSYTIDTGQSRQTVTRFNLTEIRKTIDSLYNRLATLQARRNGSGTHTAAPDW